MVWLVFEVSKLQSSFCIVFFFNISDQTSESDKVGGKDTDPPVSQLSLPPVVLGVCPGNDCDAVTGGEAQVSRLLARERVGRRDNQLSSGSADCWSVLWRNINWVLISSQASTYLHQLSNLNDSEIIYHHPPLTKHPTDANSSKSTTTTQICFNLGFVPQLWQFLEANWPEMTQQN